VILPSSTTNADFLEHCEHSKISADTSVEDSRQTSNRCSTEITTSQLGQVRFTTSTVELSSAHAAAWTWHLYSPRVRSSEVLDGVLSAHNDKPHVWHRTVN
jgi:hypothetical protein